MPNRLATSTSPYLLQHANNPVDWHPWGEDALVLARAQDKPILLSIGYSACHWCHVMAHESFEDPATAALMNARFVNIKVDREERPDLDQIYQQAHSVLSRRNGGWPLTVFLTPQQVPFYSGTYFPPTPRYGMPAFSDLLRHIASAWQSQRAEIETQNTAVISAMERLSQHDAPAAPDTAAIADATAQLGKLYDPVHGGFGGAPKFPNPADLALLLRGDENARRMALFTLSRMADGGIYDHVGGGFYRYSVDERWEIPHFEKMLYDNAQLLGLYADAWTLTGDAHHRTVASQTADWLLREMQSPHGGFFSSFDADSEGEEGRYYVWQDNELRQLLTVDEYVLMQRRFGLAGGPNFEHAWHLHVTDDAPFSPALWQSARDKLLQAREKRVRPGCDDKILTSWNGLLIGSLARAGRKLGHPEWIMAAQRAADFIRGRLWQNGRLLATARGDTAHLNAYLDDHAFLLQGLLELLQSDFRTADLEFAIAIADSLLARFEDGEHGGFFFTSHDHEALLQRQKPAHDNATPSGNGIAALSLQRLGHLLGETRYLETAERTLRAFATAMRLNPAACPTLLVALEEFATPPATVLLRGPRQKAQAWKDTLDQRHWPGTMIIALPENAASLPPTLDRPLENDVNAWVCRGVECMPSINRLDALLEALQPLGKGIESRL